MIIHGIRKGSGSIAGAGLSVATSAKAIVGYQLMAYHCTD